MRDYDRLTRPQVAKQAYELPRTPGSDSLTNWTGVTVYPDNVTIDLYVNSVWDIDQRAGMTQQRGNHSATLPCSTLLVTLRDNGAGSFKIRACE